MTSAFEPYSCLMSVYKNDNPEELRTSIESILQQTVVPDELLIVIDGEIPPSLEEVLSDYSSKNPALFRFVRFEQNCGLHVAMREGVTQAANSLIMRMDADDYSRSDRAEKQLSVFSNDPGMMLVGSNADEFIDSPENVVAHVVLPESYNEIKKFAKRRNPFRHDAVMYRKEAVLAVGNYHDVPYFEDYDLFLRMVEGGCRAYNIQEPLISVRVSDDFYMRRGGVSYLKNTMRFLEKSRKAKLLGPVDCVVTFVPRAAVCIMPNKLRDVVYKRLLRSERES